MKSGKTGRTRLGEVGGSWGGCRLTGRDLMTPFDDKGGHQNTSVPVSLHPLQLPPPSTPFMLQGFPCNAGDPGLTP